MDVSINRRYLHQDAGKTDSEISKMRPHWKHSKVNICRHMKKNIRDLVVTKDNQREDHQTYLFDKRELSYDKPSACKKRWERNFCVKGVMAKAGIPPSICEETVCRVLQKAGLK